MILGPKTQHLSLLILVACGRRDPQPIKVEPGDAAQVVADATISTWPTAPAPTVPAGLMASWPSSDAGLLSSWPALGQPTGLRLGDLTIKLQPAIPPVLARLWIARSLTASADLVTVWGPYVKNALGQAVWFDASHGIKARYPAVDAAGHKGIEIAPYTPVLDRVAAAPELLAGAPLLGQPATALDRYQPWIVDRDANLAQLWLPPGEFDTAHLPCAVAIHQGRIWRVRLTIATGPAPHDEAGVRARLDARWGQPTTNGELVQWRRDGVTVALTSYRHTVQLDYEVSP